MIKRKLGGMFIAVSFILGVPAGILGSIAITTTVNNKVRKVEREKYKDVLPFLLETENGVPIKAKVKDPIVVNVDMTGEERKQAIKAIHDLDSISNTLNYKIIDTDNSSIYADINISVDKNLQEAKEALGNINFTYKKDTGYLIYPLNITIDDSIVNYYSSNGVSLVDYVVKHEMMHTLGFKDIYDEQYFNKTIMWHSVDNGMELDDFSELDKNNIKSMYDNDYISVARPENMKIECKVKQKEEELSM